MLSLQKIVALLCISALAEGKIQTEDKKTRDGKLRYTYDDSVRLQCESILLIGVGTAMSNSDYDILAAKISTGEKIVTVFTDHSRTPVKLSDKGYAKFYNRIVDNLDDLIPICRAKAPKIFIGGHSASGSAASKAVANGRLDRKPDGFIGLDPYNYFEKRQWLPPKGVTPVDKNLPMISWGFEKTTCFTTIGNAAKAAYRLSGDDHRVFYRIQNASTKIKHCEFTNKGCFGPICSSSKRDDVKDAIVTSIHVFIAAIKKGSIKASDFAVASVVPSTVGADLFVNADVPN